MFTLFPPFGLPVLLCALGPRHSCQAASVKILRGDFLHRIEKQMLSRAQHLQARFRSARFPITPHPRPAGPTPGNCTAAFASWILTNFRPYSDPIATEYFTPMAAQCHKGNRLFTGRSDDSGARSPRCAHQADSTRSVCGQGGTHVLAKGIRGKPPVGVPEDPAGARTVRKPRTAEAGHALLPGTPSAVAARGRAAAPSRLARTAAHTPGHFAADDGTGG
jgi:hypothetical protein